MGRAVRTEIDIAAPPSAVWSVLTDFEAYTGWNPFLKRASANGPLKAGGRIEFFAQPPGQSGMTIAPKLLRVEPQQELRWRGSLPVPYMFVGEHYFLLEAKNTGTRLVHGEDFSGLLVPFLGGMLKSTEEGFKAMNEKLKERVEQQK